MSKLESEEYNKLPWALFLKSPQSEVVKMYKEKMKELREMAKKLEEMSQDEETREIYESRQKAIHDHLTNLKWAAEEGRRKDKEKGKREGKKEGMKEMIELTLKIKFGSVDQKIINRINEIDNLKELKEIKRMLKKAASLEAFEEKCY